MDYALSKLDLDFSRCLIFAWDVLYATVVAALQRGAWMRGGALVNSLRERGSSAVTMSRDY